MASSMDLSLNILGDMIIYTLCPYVSYLLLTNVDLRTRFRSNKFHSPSPSLINVTAPSDHTMHENGVMKKDSIRCVVSPLSMKRIKGKGNVHRIITSVLYHGYGVMKT